jgi:menaquinol-cytochrome c reductase iron-sulfur subunit
MWGTIAAALGLPALAYLLFPAKAQKENEWQEIGDTRQLQTKVPTELVFRRNRKDGWTVISEKSTAWVVKMPDQSVVAYGPHCTHLGCAYHWDDRQNAFFCPCHNSVFAIDGTVTAGPAPRRLDRFDLKVEGNKLLIGALRESEA